MKLADYMTLKGLSPEDVFDQTKIPESTVYAYMDQRIIPRPRRMKQIIAWSKGEVMAGDFYK